LEIEQIVNQIWPP